MNRGDVDCAVIDLDNNLITLVDAWRRSASLVSDGA